MWHVSIWRHFHKSNFNTLSKVCKNWVLSTFQLCGSGPLACCITGDLDNAFENDFNQGSLSSFSGNNLGECNGFDMGDGPIDMSQIMTIYHSGN